MCSFIYTSSSVTKILKIIFKCHFLSHYFVVFASSHCSQFQDGSVLPFGLLFFLLILVTEGYGALNEFEGLQHGGGVGHFRFTEAGSGYVSPADEGKQ